MQHLTLSSLPPLPAPTSAFSAQASIAMITEQQHWAGMAGIWVCWSFCTVFIGLRFYCKQRRDRKAYWDDWLLAAAWLSLLVVCAVSTVNLNISVQPDLPSPDTIVLLARINLVSVTFSIMASSWSKVSFAVTLLRISDGWIRQFLWAAIVLCNLFFGLAALFWWVSCKPLEKAWTPIVAGTCWNPWVQVYVAIAVSAFSGVLDICFALLPWRILFAVRFVKERVGVAIAMSMGIAAGVFAFVKCAYFQNFATWADSSSMYSCLSSSGETTQNHTNPSDKSSLASWASPSPP